MNAFFMAYLERMEKLHNQIKHAIEGLSPEALDWVPGPYMNSISVLVVHTTGSERYWIGDVALEDPSGRDREAEFHVHGLDETALKARLDGSLAYAKNALSKLPEENLSLERYSPLCCVGAAACPGASGYPSWTHPDGAPAFGPETSITTRVSRSSSATTASPPILPTQVQARSLQTGPQ